jgi:hypothetical protein
MVVVPLLAMVSHHLPPQLATTACATLWKPLAERLGWADAGPSRSSAPRVAASSMDDSALPAAVAAGPVSAAPPAVPTPGPVMPAFAALQADPRRMWEDRLVELGAATIDCQPVPGGAGGLVASCRVAVDPAGQLQRVFQAAGADPPAALQRLAEDVEAWKRRTGGLPPAAPGS